MADLMARKGISQSELGRRLGRKQGSIQSIVAGKVRRPTILKEIAEALGTSQEYLLGLTDDPTPREEAFADAFRSLGQPEQKIVLDLVRSLQARERNR